MMLRVGFLKIGGAHWTGGINYLVNVLSALHEANAPRVRPLFFASPDDGAFIERVSPFLHEPPILSDLWSSQTPLARRRQIRSIVLQRDKRAETAFRDAGVDVVFHHCSDFFGARFGLPTLSWVADYQHRRLPQHFSRLNYWKRDLGYSALARWSTVLVVSSEDARNDAERFYPVCRGKVEVLRFVARLKGGLPLEELPGVRDRYGLPDRFFYMPNQFWKQKNHLGVLAALRRALRIRPDIVVAASGNLHDTRDRNFPREVVERVKGEKMEDAFRILGMIPFDDILPLMRLSVGVINPSFFEGWSTPVEEAKSVGAPLLLSSIPVHREQADGFARFFDPADVESMADALLRAWDDWPAGPRPEAERDAAARLTARRAAFAERFCDLAELAHARFRAGGRG